MSRILILCCAATLLATAQSPPGLTFHASFDDDRSLNAKFALGDARIYSAPSYKELSKAQPGTSLAPAAVLAPNAGRKGHALRFTQPNKNALFFYANGNVAFSPNNWTGTISFWLSVDPETELHPNYTDPLQITDKDYNDSAIWTDFTKDDKPRHFRLGIFGALKTWNPTNKNPDQNPDFLSRLVVVRQPPFAKGKWTHIAITHEKLGSGKGQATFYLNGQKIGDTPAITEPFAWEMDKATIRLGVAYTGLLDELMIFNRPLTAKEIQQMQ
jgi:hypothetical protein